MISMKKRSLLFLGVISLVLAVILALGSFAAFAQTEQDGAVGEDEITVVRLVKDAPIGTVLTEDFIELVTMKNVNIPANAITDIETCKNKYMLDNVYEGEYLYPEQLSEKFVSLIDETLLVKPIKESTNDYVNVTEYVLPNTGENIAYFLQEIIDKNPNRCIYFPAGEYVIAEPLKTSSNPNYSVSILLDDGAVIKAADNWRGTGDNALICLGGTEIVNDIKSKGSYYTLIGGVLDANGKANGIAVSGGRETVVRNICIKNPKIGISIPRGTNNMSADCDFEDITIIGEGRHGTIGVYGNACDNTYTNIRIYDMNIGMDCGYGGEVKSIYVINTEKSAAIADSTVGFTKGSPRMTECYTENCATGFNMDRDTMLNECTSVWTSASWKKQVMFDTPKGQVLASGCRAIFMPGEGITTVLAQSDSTSGTEMYYEGCIVDVESISGEKPEGYFGTPLVDAK